MLNRAAEHLESILKKNFAPFPKWGEPGWQNLPEETRRHLIRRGEALAAQDWLVLPATVFMEFQRNGNRSHYENIYFERRNRLLALVLAECAEGKGRFVDAIINGAWAICEETGWVIPAHNNHHYDVTRDALPNFTKEHPYIDLFSAETGSTMSWVYYFMSERLGQESELIPLRIRQEIKTRIIDPFLALNDMHWMGLNSDVPVNNWNPWINSNVQTALLLMEDDEARRTEGLKKVARSAQRFLDFYEEDGGCDEGPSYFNVAGASMLDILEMFFDATDGQFNVYGEKLIANMADYIRHAHIAGPYFVNFADAPSRLENISAGCLLRAGQYTGNEALSDFARTAYKDGIAPLPWIFEQGHSWTLFRRLKALFTYTEADFAPIADGASTCHYFPGIQVPVVRTQNGLFFAAKGGHNSESHNHNDIGNYILYADGEPCVIDAGVGVYSKKTFSDLRYTIWSMQSGYHNTAIVNGCDQQPGKQYAAHSAVFEEAGDEVRFALNIEKAYAENARLAEYRREFVLDRISGKLAVTDRVAMAECTQAVQLPILCYTAPAIGEGCVSIGGVSLRFDPAQFTASFEEISLDDPENPITCWKKNTLYRLLLTRTALKTQDSWTLTYTRT